MGAFRLVSWSSGWRGRVHARGDSVAWALGGGGRRGRAPRRPKEGSAWACVLAHSLQVGGMGWDERTHSPWRLCTPPSQQAFHTHCHAELPFGPSHLSNPHHPLPPHPLAALADPGVDLGAQRPPLKPGIWNLDTRDIPWRTRRSGGGVEGGRGRLGEGPAFPPTVSLLLAARKVKVRAEEGLPASAGATRLLEQKPFASCREGSG